MATELAKAYVQIVPSAKNIKSQITSAIGGDVSSAGDSAGKTMGSSLVSSLKGVIAAAGIGAFIKSSLDAGGAIQQSFGGLDTLYGEASQAAKNYAAEAAKAGISANDYAEQAVSFGAALKMAFGGDTTKAVESANTAILDMTDNAAKMGTPLESIQNAYQGFAKQNYTMLDNLKLGYGGTKTEMERLLADAQKLSGVEYNLDNLGDVYEAIHVIQQDLGLTGVAAEEAADTFTGSMGAMKASWDNLLANLSTGQDITEPLKVLTESAMNFVTNNMLPMIGNVLQGLPQVLESALGLGLRAMNIAANNSTEIVNTAVTLITKLVETLITGAPYLAEAAINLAMSLGKALITFNWSDTIKSMVNNIKNSMSLASGEILGSDKNIIDAVLESITKNLPGVLQKGVEIVSNVANGILQNLPKVIEQGMAVATKFAKAILDNLPTILEAGKNLLLNLAKGIIQNLPEIVKSAQESTSKFMKTIMEHLPEILETGLKIIGELVVGIIRAIPDIISSVIEITTTMRQTFFDMDWLELGGNIIDGIVQGLKDSASAVWDSIKDICSDALQAAKDALGIHSPSKLMREQVGRWIPEGMADGIEDNVDSVTKAMKSLSDETVSSIDGKITGAVTVQNMNLDKLNKSSKVGDDRDVVSAIIDALNQVSVTMDGKMVGTLVADSVNQTMGRINARRV